MANKRFMLGMLVMVLVFGMTVIGCEPEPEPEPEPLPRFRQTITVMGIPGNRNGQTFTMGLLYGSQQYASEEGIITGNNAEAKFEVEKLPVSGIFGDDKAFYLYLSLKIGNDTVKVTSETLRFSIATEAADGWSSWGSRSILYQDLFGGN